MQNKTLTLKPKTDTDTTQPATMSNRKKASGARAKVQQQRTVALNKQLPMDQRHVARQHTGGVAQDRQRDETRGSAPNQHVQDFFAPCPRGLEAMLAQELQGLGLGPTEIVASGVKFRADWDGALRANTYSRVASRILWRVAGRRVQNEAEIYQLAMTVPWETYFHVRETLRVDTVGIRAQVRSLEFISLKVKDAVCDRFNRAQGVRPSIDKANAGMRVQCVLDGWDCYLYLDTSGDPLFKRGWRAGNDGKNGIEVKGEAAMKENLAAGLLQLTGWTPDVPLFDPMCGSGTFVIEAAQQACGLSAGGARRFAMQRFWHVQVAALEAGEVQPSAAQIYAGDIDETMLPITARNAMKAGLPQSFVHIAQGDATTCVAPCETPGIIVMNPPYEERLDFADDVSSDAFYEAFAANLKRNFMGWSVWIITPDPDVQSKMRLKPDASMPVFNGALACRWLRFDIR